MARLPRLFVAGYPLHVVQRGNNRTDIFLTSADRAFFLRKLQEASRRHGCLIHAYVLMSNHVHLLLTPATEHSLPSMMQSIGRSYVLYFNTRSERTGTLWEGRYRSALVDTDAYFLACMRYIEMNPVRAGLAPDPSRFWWSSHRCNALGTADELVTPHHCLLAMGDSVASRCVAYRQLFDSSLEPATIDAIRRATNGSWALGDRAFQRRIQISMPGRPVTPKPRGGDRKSERGGIESADQWCLTLLK